MHRYADLLDAHTAQRSVGTQALAAAPPTRSHEEASTSTRELASRTAAVQTDETGGEEPLRIEAMLRQLSEAERQLSEVEAARREDALQAELRTAAALASRGEEQAEEVQRHWRERLERSEHSLSAACWRSGRANKRILNSAAGRVNYCLQSIA